MGKKRGKERSRRELSSIELTDVKCTHIRKAVDHSWLRRIGLDKNWNSCQECQQEGGQQGEAQSENENEAEDSPIWMCLKCGHRGCGRFSKNRHALIHHEKPHSDLHCLVINLETWIVWCYACDTEVCYSSTGQLSQLISTIRKQVLDEPEHQTTTGAKEENCTVNEEEPKNEEPTKGNKKCTNQNGPEINADTVSVRGLSNLGNTCFFNAVLQNLSQTWLLRQLLSDFRDEEQSLTITPPASSELDPLQVHLPKPGSLTIAMCRLLNEIQETKKNVVTPQELFTQVCKKATRFKGYQQQDSQELLRYLLDGMRAEESIRRTTGILAALKKMGDCSEAEQKKLTKDYERNGWTKSFVEEVFGGEMTSTVMCKECKAVSVVTEMFLDLSLPVTDEAYRKKKVIQPKKIENGVIGKSINSPPENDTEDMPTGAGSKYQQKKAKKQAKKQAKNQKHQQKQGTKFTLNSLTNQEEDIYPEVLPSDIDGQVDTDSVSQLESEVNKPDEPTNDNEQKEEEEEIDDLQSSDTNRFISLSEERAEEQNEVQHEEQNEGQNEESTNEVVLSESMRSLILADEKDLISEVELEQVVENGKETEPDKEFVLVNRDPDLAFTTLAPNRTPNPSESSVESSLHQFTQVEELTNTNSLLCVTCSKRAKEGTKKVYREALKQILISSPPPVLTLHLKRFQQTGYSVCKVNRHVQFPQVLDLAPFCSYLCTGVDKDQTQVLYSLYGVVEHSGTMRSGHYTAFVKSRPNLHTSLQNGTATPLKGSWFYISDSSVQPVPESKVQSSQAYLLFYERIS